jgi:cholesterol transport system auxiliary component
MKQTLLAALLLLTACGGGKSAPELYRISSEHVAPAACHSRASVKLYEPKAGPGLDSARIAVFDGPQHQTFYSNVRWSSPAPIMVQHYLADRVEQSGLFASVMTDEAIARPQWLLESQLREFAVDQQTQQVRVRLSAHLVRAADRQTVLSMKLDAQESIAGQSMPGIAAAFNRGMDRVADELLQQVAAKLPGCAK